MPTESVLFGLEDNYLVGSAPYQIGQDGCQTQPASSFGLYSPKLVIPRQKGNYTKRKKKNSRKARKARNAQMLS